MDKYTGILDAAVALGIVEKNKAWYSYNDNSFQKGGFSEYRDAIFEDVISKENEALNVQLDPDEAENDYSGAITAEEATALRKTRGKSTKLDLEEDVDDDSEDETGEDSE
jgi:RecA DNA recombination protein